MSSKRKSDRKEVVSKSLSKLKNFKETQRLISGDSNFKTKMSEILETKRCTNVCPTPIESIQSSIQKPKQSIFSSTQLQSCEYQLKLYSSP